MIWLGILEDELVSMTIRFIGWVTRFEESGEDQSCTPSYQEKRPAIVKCEAPYLFYRRKQPGSQEDQPQASENISWIRIFEDIVDAGKHLNHWPIMPNRLYPHHIHLV